MRQAYEWNLEGVKLPVELSGTQQIRLPQKFTILSICRVNFTGERHTIFSKRAPETYGNRPGVILQIHGSRVEFLSFGDGDRSWYMLTSQHHVLKPGQNYEILAARNGRKGFIYVNGIEVTGYTSRIASDDRRYFPGVSSRDVNCDEPITAGVTLYKWNTAYARQGFNRISGKIHHLGLITDLELPKSLLGYPPERTWLPMETFAKLYTKSKRLIFA